MRYLEELFLILLFHCNIPKLQTHDPEEVEKSIIRSVYMQLELATNLNYGFGSASFEKIL